MACSTPSSFRIFEFDPRPLCEQSSRPQKKLTKAPGEPKRMVQLPVCKVAANQKVADTTGCNKIRDYPTHTKTGYRCLNKKAPVETKERLPVIAEKNYKANIHCNGPLGVGHADNMFNSARNQVDCRFSTGDWEVSNKANFNLSERERGVSERLRIDAMRSAKSIEQQNRERQLNNNKKLNDRKNSIKVWKNELNSEINKMENEMELLRENRRLLEKFHHDMKTPFSVADECLMQREERRGIDKVNDQVEKNLIKEINIIRKSENSVAQILEKTKKQLSLNRAIYQDCYNDATNKHHAESIDERMHQLHNNSTGIDFHPGIERLDNTISVPDSWIQFTKESIGRSQKERKHSESLRGEIDSLLSSCSNKILHQFNCVNNSFNNRIIETKQTKNKLENHINKINEEIQEMENVVYKLHKGNKDMDKPMMVAQTRLEERTHRIHMELCNDYAMKGLQREVNELNMHSCDMNNNIKMAESALMRLIKTRDTLEYDLAVKDNSLQIDDKFCMGMRRQLPMIHLFN